jgi:signal transduction histidine kinase
MIRLLSRSLATQFIGLTLAALVISQALTFVISLQEHTKKYDAAVKAEFFSRASSMTRLLGSLPPDLRQQALHASETRDLRYWFTDREPTDANAWRLQALVELSRPLENLGRNGSSKTKLPDAEDIASANVNEGWYPARPYLWPLPQPAYSLLFAGNRGYGMRAQLDNGSWLNAAFYQREKGSLWTTQSLTSLGLTAAILALIGVFIARRIARPLRNLAISAEALGRGENLPPLPDEGPDEIRRTAESFNKMQTRLHRFVEDRTKMLAAIGHDLRTPLTSLRLRAELVTDADMRSKMLSTIEELQAMTEAAIAFARGESTEEETRTIELEALIDSICDDQADLGHPVTFVEGDRMNYRCRPAGLRRAVRNLVENAVRYGGEANVRIRHNASTIDIVVEDRGPGIPDEMAEKVFSPFVRLETSRNRDTGGIGLGLSIARAVARQHGGDISFINSESGMQAILSLPRDGSVSPAPARKTRSWSFGKTVRVSDAVRLPEAVALPPSRSN